MDKAKLKRDFLQKYTPGNYTDAEFGNMADDFESDLNEYAQQVSRETFRNFITQSYYAIQSKNRLLRKFDKWQNQQ